MKPISPQPGNAQSAQTFVGRVDMTRRAEKLLSDGQNLLLTDPRRMGKTQWLRHLERTTTSFTPVFVNLEAVRSSDELFEKTARALAAVDSLPRKFLDGLRQVISSIDQITIAGNSVRTNFDDSGAQRLHRVIAHLNREVDDVKPVLLLIDELPLALRNITQNESPEAARIVLQTLRDTRMTATCVRWILCGSIGLHHVIAQCRATHGDVNDLQSIPLGPLQDAESTELATRLLLGAGIGAPTTAASEALSRECGDIPFLMHKIALLVSERSMSEATAVDIEELFTDFLDDRDNSNAVTHFIERFDMNYGGDQKSAMALLDRIAREGELTTHDLLAASDDESALTRVIDLLIDDHYLLEARGVIRWRYPVLQRIWSHRRRLG